MFKNIFSTISDNHLIRKGISDTVIYAFSVLFGRLLTILVIPYLAVKLTLKEVAYYDLFLIGTSYMQLFLTLGIDSGIAIKIADHKDEQKNLSIYFSLSMLIVLALGIVAIIIAIPLFFLLKWHDFIFIIILLVQSFLLAIQYISYSYFKWLGESKKASLLMSVGYGFGVVIGLLLINSFDSTLITFLMGLTIGNLIGVFISVIISYPYIDLSVKKKNIAQLKILFKLSLPFFYNGLLNQTFKASDRFIMLFLFNDASLLGVYSIVVRVCQVPIMGVELILNTFQAILFVNYRKKEGIELYNKILNASFVSIGVLLVLVSITVQFISPYIDGLHEIAAYTFLVPFIYLNASFISIRMLGGFSYFIHGKTIYLTYITLASILVYFVLALVFCPFGIIGIALSAAITSILSTYFYYYCGNRMQSFNENLNLIFRFSIFNLVIAFVLTFLLK